MRLTRLFLLTTGLLLSLVTVLLARSAWVDWQTVKRAEAGLAAMERAHLALKVAEKASAERGPSNQVLGDGEPFDPKKRARMAEFRRATDAAFDTATAALADAEGAAAAGLAELEQARTELQLARAELDRVSDLPYAHRSAPGTRIVRAPVEDMFAVIDTLFGAVTTLSGEAETIYPELAPALISARYAGELREYAGRLGSVLNAPLVTQAPPTRDELRALQLLEGRIEQLRRMITLQSRHAAAPLRDAVRRMQASYFDEDLRFVQELAERGQAGQPYGVNSADFVARYVPPMRSIVELRDTLYKAGREAAKVRLAATRERMVINIALGVAVLCIDLAVFLFIRQRVLAPLLRSTRMMTAIMAGKEPPPGTAPDADRADEIGDLKRAVAALRDATARSRALEVEREQLIEQLRVASDTDFLTGLPNRRAFTERAHGVLALARRQGAPVSLVVFDLDHFKRVNDVHGHLVGDEVLRTAASHARTQVRAGELLARHGGEEFVMLAPHCDAEHARQLAERLRATLDGSPVVTTEGKTLHITASFGVACAETHQLADLDALFRDADAALYAAKAQGRNRVVLATACEDSTPKAG